MEITLKNRKITTIGGSKGFIIPKAFLDTKYILDDKPYTLIIKQEVQTNGKQKEETGKSRADNNC